MEPRMILEVGRVFACIEDENIDRHLMLRIGTNRQGSHPITLNTLNARKLAYALLLEADTLDFKFEMPNQI